MNQYLELVELQKETIGATFVLGFSTKSKKHYCYFNNGYKKRFEHSDICALLTTVKEFILEKRQQVEKYKYSIIPR